MAVKKEDAEALANECAQLTTGLPMGDPLPEGEGTFWIRHRDYGKQHS